MVEPAASETLAWAAGAVCLAATGIGLAWWQRLRDGGPRPVYSPSRSPSPAGSLDALEAGLARKMVDAPAVPSSQASARSDIDAPNTARSEATSGIPPLHPAPAGGSARRQAHSHRRVPTTYEGEQVVDSAASAEVLDSYGRQESDRQAAIRRANALGVSRGVSITKKHASR